MQSSSLSCNQSSTCQRQLRHTKIPLDQDFHLFFDLDRTLWDFDKNSQQALRILYDELEIQERIGNFYDFYHKYKNINSDLWVAYGRGKITKDELRNTRFEKTLKKFGIEDEELN